MTQGMSTRQSVQTVFNWSAQLLQVLAAGWQLGIYVAFKGGFAAVLTCMRL